MRLRIGEILVARSVITPEQLETALQTQIVNGARLGTNLIDLYELNLDVLTEALASQYEMPPALQKHFETRDIDLARRLSPEQAKEWNVIPLRTGSNPPIVGVACMGPLSPAAVAGLEGAFQASILQALAPELRIMYFLEHVYGIERSNRYRRPRPRRSSIPPDGGAERRNYAHELNDRPKETPESMLGKIAIKKIAIKIIGDLDPSMQVDTVEDTVRAMRRCNDREKVGQVVVTCLHRAFDAQLDAGLVFIIREHLGICWQGFARHPDVNLEGLGVPLDQPGVLSTALKTHAPFYGPAPGGGTPLDKLLWEHLQCDVPAEVAVVPAGLSERVGCLIYVQSSQPLADSVRQGIGDVSNAVGMTFRRLLRAAER